jgi:PAS domain S-box-containing protein
MAVAMHPIDTRAAAEPAHGAAPDQLDLGPLFDCVLEAVIVAQLRSGRIVMWNPAAEKLFGYSARRAIGKSIEMLMPAPIAQVHHAGLERYMRTGRGLIVDADGPVEMPALTSSGEEIRVELALREITGPDGERYAVAMIRDAMQRKTLELTNLELVQARVARSEAESDLAARDELLDTVIETLQAGGGCGDLDTLVDALREFRRLHTGQLSVRLGQIDLVDVAHAAADAARRRSTGRRLVVDAPPKAAVTCDPARMRQVLDQVLDEAIRRTSGGARIELRLEMVSRHLAQLTIRSDACGDTRPAGASLQLSRTLVQRQGGTFATAISSGGSLEVIMTLPGSPPPGRRKSSRSRKLGHSATS